MAGNSYSLGLAQTLLWKVRNFPESSYSFNPGDNLTTLMSTLLGQTGTGQLDIIQVAARLSQQYLQFSDLETTLGELLSSPRTKNELYSTTLNPFTDQLTPSEWKDVLAKDSIYRERLVGIAAALLRGATNLGLQMLSESNSSSKFVVVENWTTASGVVAASGYGRNLGVSEVILMANTPSDLQFTTEDKQTVTQNANHLQPLGTNITVYSGTLNTFTNVAYTSVSGSSEFFTLKRSVLATNVNIPTSVINTNDPGMNSRYWLINNQAVTAPYFAFTETQEQIIDTTSSITTVQVTDNNGNSYNSLNMLGLPGVQINATLFGEY